MPTIDQWIGTEIRERRRPLKISQSELATRVRNCSPVTMTLIETGKQSITIKQLHKVCEALGCKVTDIIPSETDIKKYNLTI